MSIWALIFVNIAFLITLRTKTEAAGEPDVYRVAATSESAQTKPETAEIMRVQDLQERDEAVEDDSEGGGFMESTSEPSIETESDCADELLEGSDAEDAPTIPFSASYIPSYSGETEDIGGAASVFAYTEQDVHDLAVAVYLEAGDASERAKLLVANVVINHIASPEFPDTVYGVLTVPYHYGTMAWDGVEFPVDADPALVEECMEIARRVLDGERLCPANVIGQAEFIQGSGVFEYIGGIYFCYY